MEWAKWTVSLAAIVVGNIVVWSFVWGKYNQRLTNVEKAQENPVILPECQDLFRELKESVGHITGKMDGLKDTVLLYIEQNEKEKKTQHNSKRRSKQ